MTQTILITGANRGIGLALARALIEQGHHVIAAARHSSDELDSLEYRSTGRLHRVTLDVNDPDSIAAAAESVVPAIDVLVNNAAIFPEEGDESVLEIDLQHFRDAFETNVLGVIQVTRAFLPLLRQSQNPRIVNISSGAGSISQKDDHAYLAYSTSKAALNMVTRAMAAELRGVCIVALTPGWVQTDMGGANAPLRPEESAEAIAKTLLTLTRAQSSHFIERTGEDSAYAW